MNVPLYPLLIHYFCNLLQEIKYNVHVYHILQFIPPILEFTTANPVKFTLNFLLIYHVKYVKKSKIIH